MTRVHDRDLYTYSYLDTAFRSCFASWAGYKAAHCNKAISDKAALAVGIGRVLMNLNQCMGKAMLYL